MSDNLQEPVTQEELIELFRKFRGIKHDVSNALAVMMALAEMAQRKPEHAEKLCRTVLNKSPRIVEQMQEFGSEFRAIAKPPPEDNPLENAL